MQSFVKKQAQVEVEVPKVSLKASAHDFKGYPTKMERNPWPGYPQAFPFECPGLDNYLKVSCGIKKEQGRANRVVDLSRFFGLLTWDSASAPPEGVLIAIMQQGLIPEIFDLPCMDMFYSWPRNMRSALSHFCDYFVSRLKVDRHRP